MSKLENIRVAILATHGFEESELVEPKKALEAAGAIVTVVSLKAEEIQGFQHDKPGKKIMADESIKDINPDLFDAVMLPGGTMNADVMRMVPEVQAFLRDFDRLKKPIAAICHAPWELISAGLVKDRRLTSYHTIQDDIRNAGGRWEDESVVEDRNWVTSRQPSDLANFNRAMINVFAKTQASCSCCGPKGCS